MSTRAHVGIMNSNKSFEIIFTHWDGYPSHHGPILLSAYKTAPKVRALLACGNHETLTVDPFEGDVWGESEKFDNFDKMKNALAESWADYLYIFDAKHVTWKFCRMYGDSRFEFKTLTHKDYE